MSFNPSSFINEISPQLIEKVGNSKVLIAVSGGVDSTTAAALAYRVLGERVIPVMIDTGFLRENEASSVREMTRKVIPNLVVEDKSEEFLSTLEGVEDAEEKRKKFRDIFYNTISSLGRKYGTTMMMQGTIAADWVETQGGIKTQHNVLVQLGINTESQWGFTVIEPLADLYKNEVRELARFLGLPPAISERQPFPGPGLLIRTVGKVTREKLLVERQANSIVERRLEDKGFSQYFAVTFDSDCEEDLEKSKEVGSKVKIYKSRATGVKGDVRSYGHIASVESPISVRETVMKLSRYDITHVMSIVSNKDKGKYAVAIRAVLTEDFMTADVPSISAEELKTIANEVMENPLVKEVLFDITSKPPATIELE